MLERLKEIFKGLDTAYGQTKKTAEVRPNGKQEVRSFTIKQPVTDHLWQSHIDGVEQALVIVPINESRTVTKIESGSETHPFWFSE